MKRATALTLLGAAAGLGLVAARMAQRCYSFANKSVIITGGSRGLGLAIARQLAVEGAKLTLLARDEVDLRNAADQVRATAAPYRDYNDDPDLWLLTVPCDVRIQSDIEAAVGMAVDRFGAVDVLINNAGIIQVGPMENMGIHEFDEAMATHFYGPLSMMLEVIPIMKKRGGGRIVNIASIGGKIAVPHLVPYCASKFALVGLSDGIRAEVARDGIRVTTVCPWFLRTGSVYNVEVKGNHSKEFAWFAMGASLPGLTVGAERAARKVIQACRRGSPRLIMTGWGKAALLASELTPGLMDKLQRLANRMLPGPEFNEGDFAQTGWQSRSNLTPRSLMQITRKAAVRNNEMRHAIHEARAQQALH